MEKTKREVKEIMPLVDFVLELVDARIPSSSKVIGIDDIIKNKLRLLVMTKKDLCDEVETKKWIDKYTRDGYRVICIDSSNNNDIKNLMKEIDEFSDAINSKR